MEMFNSPEAYFIARCLTLAEQGRGTTSPNPMVGAVVLDNKGRAISEGYHLKAGGPHAEVAALDVAGEAARGGTLFVNLEPCNHTGRTPPCTERIIQAGIERVICGTLDPNPQVSGSGRDFLQNHQISVQHGFLEDECLRLNEIFFHYIKSQQPFVTLKMAMTLDGKIGTRSGKSQWITGPLARQYVHYLRSGYDAIMTTAETVSADNSSLTVRGLPTIPGGIPHSPPIRVILDRRFRLNPAHYKIFDTKTAPTWVFTSNISHNAEHATIAKEQGVEVIPVNEVGQVLDLKEILAFLGQKQITSVFVEAGGQLAGSLLSKHLVNKLYLFYGSKIMNDPMAKPAFTGAIHWDLPTAPSVKIAQSYTLENDLVVEAYPL